MSAACRLTLEEEINALHLCKQATQRIKNRLTYLKAARDEQTETVLKGQPPKWGGQPWIKLCMQGLDYLSSYVLGWLATYSST